jgi:hypothetical protein
MEQQLVLHEGERLKAYLDTEDNWTMFVGYNLDARGVEFLEEICGASSRGLRAPDGHARGVTWLVLRADIPRLHHVIPVHFPDVRSSSTRCGSASCWTWRSTWASVHSGSRTPSRLIKRRDWSTAARELYKSKWARQVGDGPGGKYDRCERLSNMLLTGADYTK